MEDPIGVDKHAALHSTLPLKEGEVIGANVFQFEYKNLKTKGQKLQWCLMTLSSLGYLSGIEPDKEVHLLRGTSENE